MAETWYAVSGTGQACGPGTRRPLSQTAGSSAATQDISTEHTWNRLETARSIQAGDWNVFADITTAAGGGAPNKVTCVVERRNASCVVQENIGTFERTMSAGTTQEYTFPFPLIGVITFAAGDILTVRFVRTNGTRDQTLRFDGAAAGDADTRLETPDESVSEITGNASPTFSFTLLSEGIADVQADASVTANLSLASSAVVDVAADASLSPELNLASTGVVPVNADSSTTLPFSLAGTGTVGNPEIIGDASLSFSFASAADAIVEIQSDSALSFAVNSTANAFIDVDADANLNISVDVDSDASVNIVADASLLVSFGVGSTGAIPVNADAAVGFSISVAGTGIVGNIISGDANLSLEFALTAQGTTSVEATASLPLEFTTAGSGSTEIAVESSLGLFLTAIADGAVSVQADCTLAPTIALEANADVEVEGNVAVLFNLTVAGSTIPVYNKEHYTYVSFRDYHKDIVTERRKVIHHD